MKLDLTMPEERLEGSVGGGQDNYPYVYGMVSGMYSKFLSKKDFEVLAMAVNIGEVIASLEKTDYNSEMEKIPKAFSDLDLETAMRKNFMRVYQEIADSLPEEDRKMLSEIILGEADLRNLKTILRSIQHSLSPLEIKLMLQAGGISSEALERLINSRTVEEFTSDLQNVDDVYYAHKDKLDNALGDYKKTGSIMQIEMALDKILIDRWLSNIPLTNYVQLKIDLANIMNLFRCRLAGMQYEKHILPSGLHLGEKFLRSLETLPVNEILASLLNTPYGPSLSKTTTPGDVNLLKIEQTLEEFTQKEVNVKAMLNPLSIWSVVHFMQLKQKEVRDIRVVLLLKAHNYPPEKIKKILS